MSLLLTSPRVWTVEALPLWEAVATRSQAPSPGCAWGLLPGECVPQSWKLEEDIGVGHDSLISLPAAEEPRAEHWKNRVQGSVQSFLESWPRTAQLLKHRTGRPQSSDDISPVFSTRWEGGCQMMSVTVNPGTGSEPCAFLPATFLPGSSLGQ